jgi:hypothetical protein
VTQDLQNGEHTDEWPAADRPFSGDDSDAPVSIDEAASGASAADAEAAADAAADARAALDNDELDAEAQAVADAADAAQSELDNYETPSRFADVTEESANDVKGAENVDITNGGARDIDATTVSITQGAARDIDATTVTINQGGAGRVQADDVSVSQGAIGLARAENLTIQEGGNAFAVMADKATLDPETSVFLLVAGSTTGDVRPVLDWRAALALGAGFAVVLSALRRLRR